MGNGKDFFKRARWRFSDVVAGIFCLVLLSQYIAWAQIDVEDYIDVQSIEITPTPQGLPIKMDVIRFIYFDFDGGYQVSIRDGRDGSVCSTGKVGLPYSMNATLKDPLYLSYWAGGGSCQNRIPSDLEIGTHTVKTCHFIDTPWYILLKVKPRCTDSILEILPPASEIQT